MVHWPHLGYEDAWLAEARALHAAAGDRHLANIVDWARVNASALGLTLLLFERRDRDRLVGYAVVEVGREEADVRMGLRLLHRQRFHALKITGGIVTADPALPPARMLGELLLLLRLKCRGLPIHLHAIPPAVLRELHEDARYTSGMVVLSEGRMQHYRMDIPASTDILFAVLNGRTRASFRRHLRRIERKCGPGQVRLEGFSRPDEVNKFLDVALQIARQSYQYQLLRSGVASNERRHQWLFDIAEAGWWRGHLLWCGDQAVAFLVSVRIGEAHYGLEMGYDPMWAEWSVGTVALLELIRSMVESDDPPAYLDFLYGDQGYKRRLSTDDWEEESEFLFPLSPFGLLHVALLSAGRRAAGFATRQLHRLGLKNQLRRRVLPAPERDPDGPG